MAVLDLSARTGTPRDQHRYTTANANWQEILLPDWVRRVSVSPQLLSCRVVGVADPVANVTGEGTLAAGDRYKTIPADAEYTIPMTAGRDNANQVRLFILTPANTDIELALEANEAG